MSLARAGAIARHELRLLRSDPAFFIIFTTMPLMVMAFIKPAFRFALEAEGQVGVNGAEQAVPGVSVMFSLFLVGNVGFSFFREHGWGTWERLRASFASPAEVMAGKVVVPLLQAALQLVVLFGLGGILYGLKVRGSVVGLALVAATFCICLVSIGLALLAVCRSVMQLNALSNLGAMVLAGVGGALAPATALPGWARAMSPAVPSYWAMRGFRSVILDRGGIGDVLLPMVVLLGFAFVSVLIAARRFRFDEAKTFFA
jgi:ABC-2 type transport system permease protein